MQLHRLVLPDFMFNFLLAVANLMIFARLHSPVTEANVGVMDSLSTRHTGTILTTNDVVS